MDQPSCCCQCSAREVLILKDEPAVTGSLGMSEPFSFSFSLTVSASFSSLLKKKKGCFVKYLDGKPIQVHIQYI